MNRKLKLILFGLLLVLMSPLLIQQTDAETTLVPLTRNGTAIYYRSTTNPVMTPVTFEEKDQEFRGVWVATVFNLNMPKHTSQAQYKAAYEELIARVKSKNMNAILFQTRPLNDAFYESDYAPYSRYLTGTEGGDPGWDVMEYMVEYAHSQGIQFHAWMNPYRVANMQTTTTKEAYLATLDDKNFAKQNPDYVIAGIAGDTVPLILDPGRPEVQSYIRNVVREMIQKYDVDGIHFDDYFYPYSGTANSADQASYNLSGTTLSREDWRRKNVDTVVRYVKSVVDTHNNNNQKNVKFGISPFGIWKNKGTDPLGSNTAGMQSYSTQYADSRNWVLNGWVHYITPQIYWQFTHTTAPFADVVDWWADLVSGTGVDLIVGHSITSSSLPDDEMLAQIKYISKHPEVKGSVLYSAGLPGGSTDYLNKPLINNLVSQYWTQPATNIFDQFNIALDAHYASTLNTVNYTTISNLNLITELGSNTITWTSSNPNVISNTGVVSRPTYEEGDVLVTLTARNQTGRVARYKVNVTKQAEPEPPLPTQPNPPTYTITGEMVDGGYIEPITIELSADPGLTIKYFFTNGYTTSAEFPYSTPFTFSNRGGWVFNAYTLDAENVKSETIQFNVRLDIPFDETNTKVIRNGVPVKYQETGKDIILPTYKEKTNEIRAVWVATVSNIDVPKYKNDAEYKAYLIDMLDTVKALNMNTVFFQVRSMNDAFYPSELAPYSQYIKGVLGEGLDWDILEFVTTEAHNRGLELHAWINPYRVANAASGSFNDKINRLHPDNFARKNPNLVMEDNEGALILNPGEPAVRQYIYDVVAELMENYDIDGIHMDDYFYTYAGHKAEHDANTFSKNNPDNLTLADWRRSNIDKLVEEIYYQVESFNQTNNRNLKWGISPIGIWRSIENDPLGSYTGKNAASSYETQYADTRKWVKEGWLHYINPQVYWEFSRQIAPYADIVKWWNDVAEGTGVKVVVGQGFYRMIESNTSMNNENEMVEQIRLNQRFNNVIGTAFFSYRTLKSTQTVVVNTLQRFQDVYWTKTVGWAWPTDMKDPDSEEVITAKVFLQDKLDEINAYLLMIKESAETNPFKLNINQKYSQPVPIQTINEALLAAQYMMDERGYTVAQIESAVLSLTEDFDTFKLTVIIGQGEEFSQEKQDQIDTYKDLLVELKELLATITASNKTPAELPVGLYAPVNIVDEINEYIILADDLLASDYISDQDLTSYRFELLRLTNTLNANKFTGTNENAINAKKAEILAYINELEAKIKAYKVATETDPSKLNKDETYISLSDLNELNRIIREAKEFLTSADSIEALEDKMSSLETFETDLEENIVIVGTKANGPDVGMLFVYIAIGVISVGVIAGFVMFFIKRRK